MKKFFDAFISYGRVDSKAFAKKLQARLDEFGFRVWFDFNDIPLAVDFQNQIDDGIEKASHFLFIISPHSVNSPYCRKEIELAIKLNKRIIPLLHVMQISQETWLQRNPNCTELDWEAYKTKGLHDSYQNMHPIIRKLNWVYFQEDQDDFEKSLGYLIDVLRSHTDYIEQHTRFLAKALEWERNQKQTNYLLVGEEKQQAESWLKIRFKDEQPPCIPTDLHCEYITESIKNGNNLMTMVFLSYAHEDRAVMERIRLSLRRESITVWTNTTDIQTGEAFEEAIKRGIEQADNVVYLLSPGSVNSAYCQFELNYALSLNKRIIPLKVREIDSMQVPLVLRELHHIDLTDNIKEEDYSLDESYLLKTIHEDAAYYNEQKILLTKALKWERQHNNPSVLLRGYNLRSAEAWLKVAQKRTQHPPTALQEKFITESLQQPPLESLDVFISYSRADSDLARKLNDALQMQGKTTWFDQESIASGCDFQEEIYRGIKTSSNFLFLLSPRSVCSPYCKDEVEYAAKLNKRFVTVLHREVNSGELHPELAKVQWIDFNQQDFNANFNQLVRTLDTDREHVHSHSKWSQRALEWEQKDKSHDLLLRGSEFAIAQNWLQETEKHKKKPAPTQLQKVFIEASLNAIEAAQQEEKRRQSEMLRLQSEKAKEAEARLAEQKKSAKRQKFFLVTISMALVAAVGFFIKAEEARQAQLDSVSRFSLQLSQQHIKFDALLEAIRAGSQLQQFPNNTNSETRSLVLTALQAAVYDDKFTEHNRLTKHHGTVYSAAWNRDSTKLVTASGDNTIRLWSQDGQPIGVSQDNNYDITSVSFSPEGNAIVSGDENGTIKLWSQNGELRKTFKAHKGSVSSVAWSPDGNTILSASKDKSVKLWSQDGVFRQILTDSEKGLSIATFSPDGKTIATASNDGTIRLWDRDAKKSRTINVCKDCAVYSLSFSPDGKNIVSGSGNSKKNSENTVKIWSTQGKPYQTIPVGKTQVSSIAWSPDGNTIAVNSNSNTVTLFTKEGQLQQILFGHEGSIKSVTFSPDGKTIVTTSEDNTVKLWRKSGKTFKRLEVDTTQVSNTHKATAESPDGNTIAYVGQNNSIELKNLKGETLQTLKGHTSKISSLSFSPDGKTLASASYDNTVKLWRKKGNLYEDETEPKTLSGHKGDVLSVTFSPDGNIIASGSRDHTVKLWDNEGEPLQTLIGHDGAVNSLSFSPDSKTLTSISDDELAIEWNIPSLELEPLMKDACDRVWNYLKYNAADSDRDLCKNISSQK
ncbi:hypothetical protein NUACC21_78730 [Scytonema sp. NUACC21]